MKKLILLLVVIAAATLFTSTIFRSDGSPGGYTGSPDDGRDCTSCHNGTAQSMAGMISSDIPGTGYVPGQTYTISLTLDDQDMVRCGFELTIENNLNQKTGFFSTISGQGTQILSGGNAITHDDLGNTPQNGSKTWQVSWTAPQASSGNLTFYVALLAGNGSGSQGDLTYLSNLAVSESQVTGIAEQENNPLIIYYNSGTRQICIEGIPELGAKPIIRIFSVTGTLVKTVEDSGANTRVDASALSPGIYVVSVSQDNQLHQQKIYVK